MDEGSNRMEDSVSHRVLDLAEDLRFTLTEIENQDRRVRKRSKCSALAYKNISSTLLERSWRSSSQLHETVWPLHQPKMEGFKSMMGERERGRKKSRDRDVK